MKKQGFSLVELLVVMAIIGTLASMAAMAYPQAVGIARRTACMSNLHNLRALLQNAIQAERDRGDWDAGRAPYVMMYKWPGTVAFEGRTEGVFVCPNDDRPVKGGSLPHPPLEYRTGDWGNPLLPFDPAHRQCVMRTGVTDEGEPYTEYCIEENLGVEAKWEYALPGHPEFSTNDGIWRIYHKPEGGRRRVVLTWYDCNWDNWLYVGGEFYKKLMGTVTPMTLYYDYAETSYGYNADLEGSFAVGGDTIVLLDYPEAYVDATDSDIYEDLNSDQSRRHLGKQNVLYHDGSVRTVGTASLYPSVNMAQWTADSAD